MHLLLDFTVYHQSKYIYTVHKIMHAATTQCTQKDLQAQNDLAKIMNTRTSNSHVVMSSIYFGI